MCCPLILTSLPSSLLFISSEWEWGGQDLFLIQEVYSTPTRNLVQPPAAFLCSLPNKEGKKEHLFLFRVGEILESYWILFLALPSLDLKTRINERYRFGCLFLSGLTGTGDSALMRWGGRATG